MISLKKADYEKILAHAKSCVPEEACGLIAGTRDGEDKVVEKVYLLANIDHSNEHFTLDPKEQLAAVKDMRCLLDTSHGIFHQSAVFFGEASGEAKIWKASMLH